MTVTERKDPRNAAGSGKRGAERTGEKGENRKRLGDNLRRMYDEVVSEPVPQEMLDLLAKLSDSSRKNDS